MPLEVIDFCTDSLVAVSCSDSTLNEVLYLLYVREDGVVKGLEVTVPEGYKFKRTFFSKSYNAGILEKYNILMYYLINNMSTLKRKWSLTNKRYMSLLYSLKLCLAENYATGNLLKRFILFTKEYLVFKFNLLSGGIK